MDFDNVIPRTKLYDKITERSFYIYEPLHEWARSHGLSYDKLKRGDDERFKVLK